jgi:transcriptional regulator with GAF, ATPase, and Fis domain
MCDDAPTTQPQRSPPEEIVGCSQAIQTIVDRIMMVAGTNSSVLILGETGTGKELVARAIHRLSQRNGRPLITVNCAALPFGLIESELFGHEKGAFSGAVGRRVGRFELAHQGTLFLDEIGELPHEIQAKLLRVLQTREFERVGGVRTIKVDVRVITATNRPLAEEVEANDFRSDLYYRLNVFPISIPPLRQRPEDIVPLARHFIGHFAGKMQRPPHRLTDETVAKLTAYSWPGNVRELESVIERAVILSPGAVIELADELLAQPGPPAGQLHPKHAWIPGARRITKDLDHLFEVLRQVGGNQTKAARLLGIGRTTLWRRLKTLRPLPDGNPVPDAPPLPEKAPEAD